MAYAMRAKVEIVWVPDGAGPMTNNLGAQDIAFFVAPFGIAGGDSLTQSNINAAIAGGLTTSLEASTAAALAQMQAWSTGGG